MKKRRKRKRPKWNLSSRVRSALRKVWLYSPMRKEALQDAQRGLGLYECTGCEGVFEKKEVHVDHKNPVVMPSQGFVGWDSFISRLLVEKGGLAILCHDCHAVKTKAENSTRKRKKIK